MEKTIWFRISNDLQVSEYEKPILGLSDKTKYWLAAVHNGRIHVTHPAKYEYPLYDYSTFNAFIQPSELKEHYLKCQKIYDIRENVNGVQLCFEICDKNDNIEKRYFGNYQIMQGTTREEAIFKGIVFMLEYGILKYWEAIIQKEENDELNLKIIELLKQIEELESKLNPGVYPPHSSASVHFCSK